MGDGLWLVRGPDLPVGAMVEVVGVDGTTLLVRAVELTCGVGEERVPVAR